MANLKVWGPCHSAWFASNEPLCRTAFLAVRNITVFFFFCSYSILRYLQFFLKIISEIVTLSEMLHWMTQNRPRALAIYIGRARCFRRDKCSVLRYDWQNNVRICKANLWDKSDIGVSLSNDIPKSVHSNISTVWGKSPFYYKHNFHFKLYLLH